MRFQIDLSHPRLPPLDEDFREWWLDRLIRAESEIRWAETIIVKPVPCKQNALKVWSWQRQKDEVKIHFNIHLGYPQILPVKYFGRLGIELSFYDWREALIFATAHWVIGERFPQTITRPARNREGLRWLRDWYVQTNNDLASGLRRNLSMITSYP